MIPVGTAAMTRCRQDRNIPVRCVDAALLVVGHGAIRITGYGSAERLIDHTVLRPATLARKGLRWRRLLPWVLRYRHFIDAERRTAIAAIQDVVHAGLAAVDDELAFAAADL